MGDTAPGIDLNILDFIRAWSLSLSSVMQQVSGSPYPTGISSEPLSEEQRSRETDLHLAIVTGGAVHGEMDVCVPRAVALELVLAFTGEQVDVEKELSPESQEAVLELFRQIAGQVATELKPRWGEVQITAQTSGRPTWTAAAAAFIKGGPEGPGKLICELQISSALAAELRVEAAATEDMPQTQRNFDHLMNVELEVTLRFGERRLLLRELLELGPGAVVELDRRVQEPVDLLLDGRLLARGEVVIVDGNYGLRVTEVLSVP
jgi:flagellar motor switch protein FliN